MKLAEQNADAIRGNTPVRQAVGDRDFTAGLNRTFAEQLKQLNFSNTFTLVPGVEHNALALLKGLGDANWEFYRTAFGRSGNSSQQ
jgi:hypothetical protein